MSEFAEALRVKDPALLPNRRVESWRWTDLQSVLRGLPEPNDRVQSLSQRAFQGLDLTRISLNRFAAPRTSQIRVLPDLVVKSGERLVLIDALDPGQPAHPGDYIRYLKRLIHIEQGGTLVRLLLAEDSPQAVSVMETHIQLHEGARLYQTTLATGAKRQRLETRLYHHGMGAEAAIHGLYLLKHEAHSDQTVLIRHDRGQGTSNQIVRGIAMDKAKAAFQGKIHVAPGADKTEAHLSHKALLLSDLAEINAKPELAIYTDDVICTHGHAVGSLDEDMIFYARSRGLSLSEARWMLMTAFLGEALEGIGDEGLTDFARDWLANQMKVGGYEF